MRARAEKTTQTGCSRTIRAMLSWLFSMPFAPHIERSSHLPGTQAWRQVCKHVVRRGILYAATEAVATAARADEHAGFVNRQTGNTQAEPVPLVVLNKKLLDVG